MLPLAGGGLGGGLVFGGSAGACAGAGLESDVRAFAFCGGPLKFLALQASRIPLHVSSQDLQPLEPVGGAVL